MKKIIIPLLFLVAALWAETKIELVVHIIFPEEVYLNEWEITDSEKCTDFFEQKNYDAYGRYLGCGYDGLCRTMLDTNVLFAWNYYSFGYRDFEFYVLSGASHTMKEIIEDEFIHYKECHWFTDNDSIYNSMLTKIDSVLIPAIDAELQRQINRGYEWPVVYNHDFARIEDFCCTPLVDYLDIAKDSVAARNAIASIIKPVNSRFESIRVQDHRLMVFPKLEGRTFMLFDVNGHEIRRGILKNNMEIPAYPTVIKIQNFGSRLLK